MIPEEMQQQDPTAGQSGDAADPIPASNEESSEMNQVCLGDASLQGAKDGDEVEFTAKGIVSEQDGKRYVAISEVDGDPVKAEDETSENGSLDDAAAALKASISSQGGYNNAIDQ